ncbi:MAG TPA: S9 family peptidase, partial [Thermoanaerobaculia bacterium]|nr:S9 family peptidase [Thermoanaerobaculia bacterium]
MKKLTRILFTVIALLVSVQVFADLPPLIPREVLFGNPERANPQLSPDGKRLAWLAPDASKVLQVWVKTIGQNDDHAVTSEKKRPIRSYAWAPDNKTLLYVQDNAGDENFHVFGVDLDAKTTRDYTPFLGARGDIASIERNVTDSILVTMNARNRSLFDAYRLNLATGALTLAAQNPGSALGYVTDKNLNVVAAQQSTPDGGTEIVVRDSANAPWRSLVKVGPDEVLNMVDVTDDGKGVIMESSVGRDTAAVVVRDIATGSEKLVASSDQVDAGIVQ